jgi:hypothetical protein
MKMPEMSLFCRWGLLIFGPDVLPVRELLNEMVDFGFVDPVMFLPPLPRVMRML